MSGTQRDINVNVTATTAQLNEAMEDAASFTSQQLDAIKSKLEEAGMSSTQWINMTRKNLSEAKELYAQVGGAAKEWAAQVISSYETEIAATQLLIAENSRLASSFALVREAGGSSGLQDIIETLTGVDREMYSASDAAKSFTSNLKYAGVSSAEAAIEAEALSIQTAELAAEQEAAAAQAAALNAEIYKMSTPTSGLKEIINDTTGVNTQFLSAKASAQAFEAELAEDTAAARALNAEVYKLSTPTSGIKQLINDLTGVNTQFLNAKASANAMATELEALEAQGMETGTVVDASLLRNAESADHATGATANVVREFITMGHEAISGRMSRIPGSLMVMAEYMGNVGTATMGVVAGVAVLAYAVVELTGKYEELQAAATDARAAMAIQNPGLGDQTVNQEMDAAARLPGETQKDADAVTATFVSMRGATSAVIADMTDDVGRLGAGMGGVAKASQEMAAAYADPAANGSVLMQDLGASTQAVNTFNAAMANNDVVAARKEELLAMNDATNRVATATGNATNSTLTNDQTTQLLTGHVVYARAATGELAKAYVQAHTSATLAAQSSRDLAAALNSVNDVTANKSTNTGQADWLQTQDAGYQQLLASREKDATSEAQFNQIKAQSAVQYWSQVANQANLTSAQVMQARQRMYEAEDELQSTSLTASAKAATTSTKDQIEALDVQLAAAKGNAQQEEDIEDQKLQVLSAAYGQDSSQYNAELVRKTQMLQQETTKQNALMVAQVANQTTTNNQSASIYKDSLQEQERAGEITHVEMLTEYKQFIEQQNAEQMQSVDTLIASLGSGTTAYANALKERAKLYGTFQKESDDLEKQIQSAATTSASDQAKVYTQAFGQIGSTARSQINQLITLNQSWAGAEQKIFGTVLTSFVDMAGQMLAKYAATMLAETALSHTGAASQIRDAQAVGASGWGSIISWMLQKIGLETSVNATTATQAAISAHGQIQNNAAIAASGAFASTAAIPMVGPELAPAAAATALAEVESFQAGATYAVGAWNLPSDHTAQVHKGEMIIPQNFAQGLRNGMSFGTPSGGNTNNSVSYSPTISASGGVQMSDVQNMLNASMNDMMMYFQNMFRNGNLQVAGR